MNLENENIDENLLGKPNEGFTVPDGYFNQLQKNILAKTSDNGFTVPEQYFENLEARILKKISKPKVIHHNFAFKQLIIGIAASIILISGFFIIKNKFYTTNTNVKFSEIKLNNLSDEEIINYLNVDDDIRDSQIAETTSNVEDKTQKQVEDYLVNNDDNQLIN